jgi:two-component system OmpR family sensor kinase
MSGLVEDLLSLARTDEALPMRVEAINIDTLIQDAANGARAAFPQRQIDVAAASGSTVDGDRDQLLRVLTNLLANAAIHTAPGGPIRICAHQTADSAVLQVVDSGPGLLPEDANRVFDRFWRAHKSRARVRGGNGLGMSIVAATIARHGGSVRFDSSVATGSTVTVVLATSRSDQ